ncbi:sulfotransferase [Myxococcota bacterium]|nr:sulfotransferase [Myxococcota bacterium]
MYFDFKTWLRIGRLAASERFSWRRARLLVLLYTFMTGMSFFNTICLLLDHIFFPGFKRVEVREPVFIVGSGRAGTTQLHRLLAGDPRFSYFRTWEILLPSILQRKGVGLVAALDQRWLGGAIERRLSGAGGSKLDKARRSHDWRLQGAEEDEFILLNNWSSGSLTVLYPYMRALESSISLIDARSPRDRARILGYYRSLVQRQVYLYGGDVIHCCKSPSFVHKMRGLMEVFPDCRFVVPVRHPYETIPSLIDMLRKIWLAMGADPEVVDDSVSLLGDKMLADYRYAFEVLSELPEDRAAVVPFGDLIERPQQVVEELYDRFGYTIGPEYAAFLEGEQTRSRAYASEHRYDAENLGPPREQVRAELSDLFERFGWEA